MSSSQSSILETLIAPHSLDDFYASYWPDKHFAVHGSLDRLPPIFRSKELQNYQAIAKNYSGYCAMTNGEKAGNMIAASENPAILLRMGLTIFLADIANHVPESKQFLQQFEKELGTIAGAARIGLFASPEKNGLQSHFDTQDIFSIQLVGRKCFRVAPNDKTKFPCTKQYATGKPAFDDLYPQSTNGYPNSNDVDFETIEMHPGSVLFIPRGTWHATEASDEMSVSVSIGFEIATAVDTVLPLLRAYLLQDPKWRKPLYGSWGGRLEKSAVARSNELLKDLTNATQNLSAKDITFFARNEEERFALFDQDTRFQHIPTTIVEIEPQQKHGDNPVNSVLIKNNDSRFGPQLILRVDGIQPAMTKMFQWLEKQDTPFNLGDFELVFGEQDRNSLNELFKVAVRSGLIKMLWFPELAGKGS